MNKSTSPAPAWGQVVPVHRGDRWAIYHRLQELSIDCACPSDGTLRVDVNHATALLLVRSTVRQFITPREEALDWLERCWESQETLSANH